MNSFSEAELKNAGAILGALAALETAANPRSSQVNAARRWIINGLWAVEFGHYDPDAMLWSRDAREAYRADPKTRLIKEHVVPLGVIRDELLRGEQTAEAYAEKLSMLMHIVYVTPAEDARLDRAGHPDLSDIWSRYRAAGLDVDGFATLNDPNHVHDSGRLSLRPRAVEESDIQNGLPDSAGNGGTAADSVTLGRAQNDRTTPTGGRGVMTPEVREALEQFVRSMPEMAYSWGNAKKGVTPAQQKRELESRGRVDGQEWWRLVASRLALGQQELPPPKNAMRFKQMFQEWATECGDAALRDYLTERASAWSETTDREPRRKAIRTPQKTACPHCFLIHGGECP